MKKIIILTFVFLVLFSCARKAAEVRWILLSAPYLMNENEPGTGLGLIICQEMVQRNGGKIWVESDLGKGTVMQFTVPRTVLPAT